MFGAYEKKSMVAHLDYDPGADDFIPIFVAAQQIEITAAQVVVANAVSAHTANYFDLALYNGGTAGTATTAIAGTIGGTAGWSALTPTAFTVSNGTVTAGQVVTLHYNEEGTGTFTSMIVQLDYVTGQA